MLQNVMSTRKVDLHELRQNFINSSPNSTPEVIINSFKMPYKIESVTTKDAPSLSPVMMKAFSHDPHWRLLWAPLSQPLPLDSIITSTTARLPRNLITGRMTKRHQKAIDISTGQIVGYARWLLPESAPPSLQWPEAQVAEPSEVEKDGKLKGLNYEVMDKLSPLLEEAEEEILKGGDYLSTLFCPPCFNGIQY